MKILILTGCGEPIYSSNMGLVCALRSLGYEVCVMGPGYFERDLSDISLPDVPHPELYSYEMVLGKAPWQPDVLINISPHCFMTGAKPPELKSCLYTTDPHREGEMIYRIAAQGSYNVLFLGQVYFMRPFYSLPMLVKYLPVGFDERRFPAEALTNEPTCHIVFIGQSGLSEMSFPFRDECGTYTTGTPDLPIPQRYQFSGHPGFDYAQRGELLYRLCRDFEVRIYNNVWQTPNYCQALRKGILGFNCSLLNDISIRILESSAAGRLVVTDDVPGLYSSKMPTIVPFELRWKCFFPNFDLDWFCIKQDIRYWLNHDQEREEMAKAAQDRVFNACTWRHRAQQILETVFN